MLIPLSLTPDHHLQQQIFEQLRALIVSNRLLPGSRMPSSRMMAEQFDISRMTVLLTYERLIAEGYVETRPAAGTFVARPPAHAPPVEPADLSALSVAHSQVSHGQFAGADEGTQCRSWSHAGRGIIEPECRVDLADPSLFPARRWRSLMRSWLDRIAAQGSAEHAAGSPALREAISGWLSASRGMVVSPDQIMLAKSRQQAIHLAAHLAAHRCEGRRAIARSNDQHQEVGACPVAGNAGPAHDARSRIVVEDPCDAIAAAGLGLEGGALLRIPVDENGLCTDQLPAEEIALVHVTPEHQRPLGVVLSRDRRMTLLAWAAHAGALILEEDVDGELRYGTMDIPPLFALDRSERVIMLGGFGISLGPWVDVAYLVLPRWLMPFAVAARRLIDDSRCSLEQMALAEFLAGGGYARHLHRFTKACGSRRDTLLEALRSHFGERTRIWGHRAGLHLVWFAPPEFGSPAFVATTARRQGLHAAALGNDAVLLGFGMPDETHIERGVRLLAENLAMGASQAGRRP